MAELPTGTVTFLFTDIEGSTRLLHELGGRFQGLVEDHTAILRDAVRSAGGIDVSTEGDSLFAVFTSPGQGVKAAVAAQRDLAAHEWPDGREVRVRMGLHTGEGRLGGDNYVGIDVHRAARISNAAHGGQIILSEATRALCDRDLPAGVMLADLGEHRLKDLPEPEHLYQLSIQELPREFPPPRSLDARPNNLPTPLTRFIGRQDLVNEVEGRLRDARLLTLTGPGGTGKTRLAIQVATDLLLRFPDGAWFIQLAPITEASLVAATIAEAMDIREEPGRPIQETLRDRVKDRDALLVLDNFEQVTDASPVVDALLAAAPKLRVIVTSRTPLHLYGEQEFPVPPLDLPDPQRIDDPGALSQFEAVQLFIDRAVSVKPDFQITNENAPAVAEVCARLDGLPLAIELAAARVKVLTPQAMLARLGKLLPLLTGGAASLPERQQTLRGAIQWSYDLLDEDERMLFACLSAFFGGCTLEAAEAVCGPLVGGDVLDGLGSLVDKSLLRRTETPDGDVRFGMLETIREFARERLGEDPNEPEILRRHAELVLAFAEEAEVELIGENQKVWLDRCDREHDNIRAALRWSIDAGEPEVGLRIAGPLWRFWQQRGHLTEGRARFIEALGAPGADAPTPARAKALIGAGGIAYWQNDYPAAAAYYEESERIARKLGDPRALADALFNLSFIPALERDYEGAQRKLEQALPVVQDAGDPYLDAQVSTWLGYMQMMQGEYEESIVSTRRGLARYRELGKRFNMADTYTALAEAQYALKDIEGALGNLREALALFQEAGNLTGIALVLWVAAAIAMDQEDAEKAARLMGAEGEVARAAGGRAPPELVTSIMAEDPGTRARAALGDDAYERTFAEGAALDLDKALAYGLEGAPYPG